MCSIYLAKEQGREEYYALKVFRHADKKKKKRLFELFIAEGEAMAKLHHRHILRLCDFGESG